MEKSNHGQEPRGAFRFIDGNAAGHACQSLRGFAESPQAMGPLNHLLALIDE